MCDLCGQEARYSYTIRSADAVTPVDLCGEHAEPIRNIVASVKKSRRPRKRHTDYLDELVASSPELANRGTKKSRGR